MTYPKRNRLRFSIRQLLLAMTLVAVSVTVYSAFSNFLRDPENAAIQAEIDKWTRLKAQASKVLAGRVPGNKEWAEYSIRQADIELPKLQQELEDAKAQERLSL